MIYFPIFSFLAAESKQTNWMVNGPHLLATFLPYQPLNSLQRVNFDIHLITYIHTLMAGALTQSANFLFRKRHTNSQRWRSHYGHTNVQKRSWGIETQTLISKWLALLSHSHPTQFCCALLSHIRKRCLWSIQLTCGTRAFLFYLLRRYHINIFPFCKSVCKIICRSCKKLEKFKIYIKE